MQVDVINLAAQQARWMAARHQFERVGIGANRVDAVDGASLSQRQKESLYDLTLNRQQYHKALSPGEIGCYASHLHAWQRLLDSPDRMVAIFEDDVELAGDVPEVLAALERTQPTWDLVKLMGRKHERVKARMPLTEHRQLIEYSRVPSHTGAYVLSRRGAAKLLARRRPFGRPVDVDLRYWWECGLVVLGVHDYPVAQAPASNTSTIEGRNGGCNWSMRMHKLLLQSRYSFLNFRNGRVSAPVDRRHGMAGDPSMDDRWSVP